MTRYSIILYVISFAQQLLAQSPSNIFSPEKAGFSVRFKNEISPYKVIGVFVLPQEELTIEAFDKDQKDEYALQNSGGVVTPIQKNKWQVKAPQGTGLYPATITNRHSKDSIILNFFVMLPFKELKGDYLNGYRIGTYPNIPVKQLPIYKAPRGFIEVTPQNENTLVSPHFQLKAFLSKQKGSYFQYLVLQERLLLKLELILEKVNKKGYYCSTFRVLSGYRTPYYNDVIGNVKYSRHLWGGAADIFIDEIPKDGMMDDLNRDGQINYKDSAIIYDIIDEMYGKPFYEHFIGGLGRYKNTRSHGPFVHVDVRGFRVRWGT